MKLKLAIGLAGMILITAFTMPVDEFVQTLTRKMQLFQKQSPQVKLFLFFNQQMYMPGDTAYFSARFITEDMLPVAGRQIIRVELIDKEGKLVFFENAAVKDGSGANQVALPSDLKAGIYQWIAYSDWMKNFSPQLYFRQDLVIVERNELVSQREPINPIINFFPEGGSLISEVTNRVVVSATPGFSVIQIREASGVQIAQSALSESGLGQFEITPAVDKQYFAEAEYQGKKLRFPLPTAVREGAALQLSSNQSPAKLEVRVPKGSKLRDENLWMVISARSEVFFTAPIRFDNREMVSIQFPQQELPTGICYATIFNERGDMLAERLFAVAEKHELVTEVRKEKPIFDRREPINLQVSVKDDLGNPVPGEYAVSIVNKKFVSNLVRPGSIENYLLINSDLASPHSLVDDLDLFLITQKNIRINWQNVWSEKNSTIHPFKRLIQYSGKVNNRENGQPVPDSSRLIAYLQKNMMGYEAYTRKDGSFDLAFLFDFWNEDEIFYIVENKRGKELSATVKWQIDTVTFFKPEVTASVSESKNTFAEYQLRNQLITKSYNFYKSQDESAKVSDALDPNRDFEDELSGADYTIKVEDYVVFPTMEELIREVIPSLQHRKVKGKSNVKVILPDGAVPPDGPLYMIDGIMTRDSDYFLQLKPGDVITVKIVRAYNKLTRMGSMAKNGIVLVHTKGVDHKALRLTNTMLPVKGINKPAAFRVPNHSDRIPDFRSTLFWNPAVKVDARGTSQVNFSASDDVGTFLIYIQGITADGRPFEKLDSLAIAFNGN